MLAGRCRVSELPPELLNSDPDGFAWGVWHERTPRLVGQVAAAHPYGPGQRQALDDLLAEIARASCRERVLRLV